MGSDLRSTPMTWTVRRGRKEDGDVMAEYQIILANETEGLHLVPDVVRRGTHRALEKEELATYYVAEEAGTIIGMLMLTKEWSDWRNGTILWIQSVFVHPQHRKRGVFRSLFEHVRAISVADPRICGLRLYVDKNNASAHRVYERLGMAVENYDIMTWLKHAAAPTRVLSLSSVPSATTNERPLWTIRRAALKDAPLLAEYQIIMAKESEGLDLDPRLVGPGVEEPFRVAGLADYYVAEENAQVIGMLMVTHEWSDWDDGVLLWVQSVYTHPNHRSKGVFKSLFEHVRSIVRDDPLMCGMRLYVERENERARKVYENLGMTTDHFNMMKWMKTSY